MTQTLAGGGVGRGEGGTSVAHYNGLLMWIWQTVLIPENYLKAGGFF